MSRTIKDVIVERISLVSKWEMPAVEKAEAKFSIFKMVGVFKKTPAKDIENKVDEIIKKLKKG